DGRAAKALEAELVRVRDDLRARAVEATVARLKGAREDDGSNDRDDQVRAGVERLARGDASAADLLIARLIVRADQEQEAQDDEGCLHDLLVAARAVEDASALLHDESRFQS